MLRRKRNRIKYIVGLLAAMYALPGLSQHAQGFPSKPIRVIVPFVAGGSYDTIMRIVSESLSASVRQPVVIDNRPGASAMIGADMLAKSSPDGYTIGLLGDNHTGLAAVGRPTPYNLFKDFAPISRIATLDNIIVINPNVPATSVKELLAVVKANPGKYRYGSGGVAGPTHLAAARLSQIAGLDMLHIPYKGGALAVTGLVGGEIHLMIVNIATARPHVQSGRLRALAVASKGRSAQLPNVATTSEAGLPGYEVSQFYAVMAPAKVPRQVLGDISSKLRGIMSTEVVKKKIRNQGANDYFEQPAELASFLRAEVKVLSEVVRRIDVQGGL